MAWGPALLGSAGGGALAETAGDAAAWTAIAWSACCRCRWSSDVAAEHVRERLRATHDDASPPSTSTVGRGSALKFAADTSW